MFQPMRFDLHESKEPCGVAKLVFNGLPMSQNATGGGSGAFTLQDGTVVSASWNIACQKSKTQLLTMSVHSANGRSIFTQNQMAASFQQVEPIRFLEVTGGSRVTLVHKVISHKHSYPSDDYDDDSTVQLESQRNMHFDVDLDAQISALEDLRQQVHNLRQLIRQKETDIMEHLVYTDSTEGDTPPRPLRECDDLGCVFRGLAWKIKHAHGDVCNGSPQWSRVLGCQEDPEDYVLDSSPEHSHPHHSHAHDSDEHEHNHHHVSYLPKEHRPSSNRLPQRRKSPISFVLKVTGALFLWYIFVHKTISMCLKRRRSRSISLPITEELPRIPRRRSLFGDYFRGLRHTESASDEERPREKRQQSPIRQWNDASHRYVADELSGLREAASMVSDIINATSMPRRARGSSPPPAYESEDDESYMPCLPQYTPARR